MEQKIAIPVTNGLLSAHFGHCQHFVIAEVVDGKIIQLTEEIPPPHEPGVIPKWLGNRGVDIVLAGGIGQKAVQLFQQYNILPVIGVPEKPVKELIIDFLEGRIESGVNQCSH